MKKARPKPMQVDSARRPAEASVQPGRVLVIDGDPRTCAALAAAVAGASVVVCAAPSLRDGLARPDAGLFDVIVLAARDAADVQDAAFQLQAARSAARLVIRSVAADFELAVAAMRGGAVDCLLPSASEEDLRLRLLDALAVSQRGRQQAHRFEQLKRICKRMNTARIDVTNQVDSLCNDLVHAYQELTDQISHVTAVTEFAAVIRQELDVEELLRTTLEYLLRKLGPTNAAIFLPSAGDDFTLGAYINYDCTREAGNFLLEHLADVVAPLLVDETELLEFVDNQSLADWMGDDAAYLADAHVLAFSCRHDGECLAMFTLWRDVKAPFAADLVNLLRALSAAFTRQLAHVIHVHHRHLPDDDWPPFNEPDEDSGGLAA